MTHLVHCHTAPAYGADTRWAVGTRHRSGHSAVVGAGPWVDLRSTVAAAAAEARSWR